MYCDMLSPKFHKIVCGSGPKNLYFSNRVHSEKILNIWHWWIRGVSLFGKPRCSRRVEIFKTSGQLVHVRFASNGILFNHESPRRGGTFVTKKVWTSPTLEISGDGIRIFCGDRGNSNTPWIPCPLKTNQYPLQMDGWNTTFLLGRSIFRCYMLVSGSVASFVQKWVLGHLILIVHTWRLCSWNPSWWPFRLAIFAVVFSDGGWTAN